MKEFEVNCLIEGVFKYSGKFESAYDQADFGNLTDCVPKARTNGGRLMEGHYTFYVAAENGKEAIAKAPKVFASIWEGEGINCGDLKNTDLSAYKNFDGSKEEFRISAAFDLDRFIVSDKNNNRFAVYTNGSYDIFYVDEGDDYIKSASLDYISSNYKIAEMSEEVAQKGFEECIFPEFYAPFISTNNLIEYIEERQKTIEMMLCGIDVSEFLDSKEIESRPDLYNSDYYNDEEYSDSLRIIVKGTTNTEKGYMFNKIELEVLDMSFASFNLNDKSQYDVEIPIEKYTGDRDGKLESACHRIIEGAIETCKLTALIPLNDKNKEIER